MADGVALTGVDDRSRQQLIAWDGPARVMQPGGLPDPEEFGGEGTSPWDWANFTQAQAELMWDRLTTFVAYLNARYAWSSENQLPPCWALHGALVEELTTLWWSRWSSFTGPSATPEGAQRWHNDSLPGFYRRIPFWLGGDGAFSKCRGGNHTLGYSGQRTDPADGESDAGTERVRRHDVALRRSETLSDLV